MEPQKPGKYAKHCGFEPWEPPNTEKQQGFEPWESRQHVKTNGFELWETQKTLKHEELTPGNEQFADIGQGASREPEERINWVSGPSKGSTQASRGKNMSSLGLGSAACRGALNPRPQPAPPARPPSPARSDGIFSMIEISI